MKNTSNLVLGVLLVIVGFLFLGSNLDWFSIEISFRKIAHWWPILLIIGGIGVLIDPQKRFGNSITILSIILMVPLFIFSLVNRGVEHIENRLDKNIDNIFEEDISINSSRNDSDVKNDNLVSQNFIVENSELKNAKLNFNGGAASFQVGKTDKNTFEGKTKLAFGGYKLESDNEANTKEIDFKMLNSDDGKGDVSIDLDDTEISNEVNLLLNPSKIWDLNMEIGAGDVDFDFSSFKIQKIDLNTGVADVRLRLGNTIENTEVKVESGVARVIIEVPKEVGTQIDYEGGLSAKDFDGFDKTDKNKWITENFDSAKNKITIKAKTGLSAIKIVRY